MRKFQTFLIVAIMAILAGCTSSGFHVATKDNTSRQTTYLDTLLAQAVNNLTATNDCYVYAAGGKINASGDFVSAGAPSDRALCVMMSGMLQNTSTIMVALAPFFAKELMGRVPAAPEEIVQSVITEGMKFSLMKFGIDAVSKVVNSGQVAQAQIAGQGISAAAKPPLIVTIPDGGSARLLTP